MRETKRPGAVAAAMAAVLLAFFPLFITPAGAAQARHAHAPAPCITQGTYPYLHTCGSTIEDYAGRPVRLLAVNWYGFESNDFVAAGLDLRSYRDLIDTVKALGYNALRIPFSNEMVETDPVVSGLRRTCPQGAPATACRPVDGTALLAANPELFGLTSLQILKNIVDYAGSQGLYVFLDDHRSRAGWGSQEDGVWYDNAYGYSQTTWLDDWRHVALLFANDPALSGVDLFNEPHSIGVPNTCASYLYGHGAAWGTCNGRSNPDTDWRAAAAQAGDMLLGMNPNLLVVVEGVSVTPPASASTSASTLTPNAAGAFNSSGGGANLAAAGREPVQLSVPGRLVYSVHQYYWTHGVPAATMTARWSHDFGYLTDPAAPYAAPVWIGEFGTCNTGPRCVYDFRPGSYGYWFNIFTTYLNTPPHAAAPPFSWAYWALNGTSPDAYDFVSGRWARRTGDLEPFGLLNTAWNDQSLPELQGQLTNGAQLVGTPPAGATMAPAPTATPAIVATPTPTPSPTAAPSGPRQMATLVPAPMLRVSASGLLARGRVTFSLLAQRDRSALLAGAFPYTDRIHHLTLRAQSIEGLNLSCLPSPRAQVTGTARDGHGRLYDFIVWVASSRSGHVAFTLRLSSGYHLSGDALGRAAFSCALG